jgi:hypothetical protein
VQLKDLVSNHHYAFKKYYCESNNELKKLGSKFREHPYQSTFVDNIKKLIVFFMDVP